MNPALQAWHQVVEQGDLAKIPELLTEDCVFYSPVVHTPQRGRDITVLYLSGALQVFQGGGFRYVKEIVDEKHALLEFECTVDGIQINGVDILSFSDDDRICEFKVMLRPLKAVNTVHAKMAAMLERLKQAASSGA